MFGYIYKTTNLINGKIYIGRHKAKTISKSYKGSGILLKEAINKYGKDNFLCEVIDTAETEDELNSLEIYWIDYYNARDLSIGYNIAAGGFGTSGYQHTSEAKQKMNEAKIGRPLTDSWKRHIGEASKGHKVPEEAREKLRQYNTGKHHSAEARQKMSDSHKKRPNNFTEDYRRKLRESRATAIASGKWFISDEGMKRLRESGSRPKSEEHRKHLSESRKNKGIAVGAKNPNAKKVYCTETNTVYSWAGEAAEALNINVRSIRQCCQGILKTAKGYHVSYVNTDKSN